MKIELYDSYRKLEDNYWWFVGMKDIFYRSIKRIYRDTRGLRILDVGCGSGAIADSFKEFGEVVGLDIEMKALNFCQGKGIKKLVQAEGNYLPFKCRVFDLITLFNIIEHLEDDSGFMRDILRVCKDNGRIIIATSAFNFLWSRHDLANEHKRRYTIKSLKNLIGRNFIVEKITYTNFILFPFVFIGVVLNNLFKPKDGVVSHGFYDIPGPMNKLLTTLLKTEAVILQKVNLPFGVSLLCIAKKG